MQRLLFLARSALLLAGIRLGGSKVSLETSINIEGRFLFLEVRFKVRLVPRRTPRGKIVTGRFKTSHLWALQNQHVVTGGEDGGAVRHNAQ